MPQVIVVTDDGREVWRAAGIMPHDVSALACPSNTTGSSLAAGVRRAVLDAQKIQRGEDPERASEKAMRLSQRAGS